MEDRATLRISSQHIANWLHHGVITEDQFKASTLKMAAVVDAQNAADPSYHSLLTNDEPSGYAYQAAWNLVMKGVAEPSGYTEPELHKNRIDHKLHR
jgi:malate synthase